MGGIWWFGQRLSSASGGLLTLTRKMQLADERNRSGGYHDFFKASAHQLRRHVWLSRSTDLVRCAQVRFQRDQARLEPTLSGLDLVK
jgi:hypothetical protein